MKASWTEAPVEAEFMARLQSVRAMLINQLAGAAIGPAEAKLYLATLPSEQDTAPLFKAHIQTTMNHFQSLNEIILARERARMIGSGGQSMPTDLQSQVDYATSAARSQQ